MVLNKHPVALINNFVLCYCGCGTTSYGESRPSDSILSGFKGLDHADGIDQAEGRPACCVVTSGGVLSGRYVHDGPGVCLGDRKTEVYLKDMGMTGLAYVWVMARRRRICRIWA